MKRHEREVDDAYIVSYHLGGLSEEEEALFEEQYLQDEKLFHRVGVVEDELLDAYVRDGLPAATRQALDVRLLRTDRGRRRLAMARALEVVAREQVSPRRWWKRLAPLDQPRRLLLAAPAAVLVVLGLAVALRVTWSPPTRDGAASSTGGQARNAVPTGSPLAPVTGALPLLEPGVWRSGGQRPASIPLPASDVLDVGLLIERPRGRYAVALEDARGTTVWATTGLEARDVPAGRAAVVVHVPTRGLSPGEYVVGLYEDAGGKPGEQLYQYELSIAARRPSP